MTYTAEGSGHDYLRTLQHVMIIDNTIAGVQSGDGC
jgi:hypothetical protein